MLSCPFAISGVRIAWATEIAFSERFLAASSRVREFPLRNTIPPFDNTDHFGEDRYRERSRGEHEPLMHAGSIDTYTLNGDLGGSC